MVFTTTDRIKRKGVTGGRPAEGIDSAGATVRTWLALIPSASSTVEQTDAVAAGLSGSQVRECLGEPGGVVHLEHDVRGSLGRIGGGSVNLGRGDFHRRRRRAPPRRRRNRRAATTRPGADSRAAPRGGGPKGFPPPTARGVSPPRRRNRRAATARPGAGPGLALGLPPQGVRPEALAVRLSCSNGAADRGACESISGCHFQRDMVNCTFKGAGWPTSRRRKKSR